MMITTTPIATGRAALLMVSTALLAPPLRAGVDGIPGDDEGTVSIRGRLGEVRTTGDRGRTMFDGPPDVAPIAAATAFRSRGLPRSRFLGSGWSVVSKPRFARKRAWSVTIDPAPRSRAGAGSSAATAEHFVQYSPIDCVLNWPQRLHCRLVCAIEGTTRR